MNNPLLVVEAARWNRLGRRWSIILAVLLSANLSLVLAAVSGYTANQLPSIAQVETPQPVAADVATVKPAHPGERPATSSDEAAAGQTTESGETIGSPAKTVTSEPEYAAAGELTVPPPVVTTSEDSPGPSDAGTPTIPSVPTTLVIANPVRTGGAVHFLVDDIRVSLEPGELRQFEGAQTRRVIFHPGDEFENVTIELTPGVFVFSVTTSGWQLEPAGDEAEVLLQSSRQAAK